MVATTGRWCLCSMLVGHGILHICCGLTLHVLLPFVSLNVSQTDVKKLESD